MFNNIGLMPKDKGDERRAKWQANNMNTVIKPGDYVKKTFTQKKMSEHMWVEVISVDGEDIVGTLDNDPMFITNVKSGQVIKMRFSQIADHIPHAD